MEIGNSVKLITFLGTKQPNGEVRDDENYWKLIGRVGTVVSEPMEITFFRPNLGPQVMVDYGVCVTELGLADHNPEGAGKLRSFVSDLIIV